MIKTFDKQNLQNMRMDFDAAIKQVAQKYGIQIALKTLRYDSTRASGKIEFLALGNDGTLGDSASARDLLMKSDFTRYAESFGLKAEQYGTIFKHGRDTYKLVGLKPRAPRMPILATNVANGTTYKLPESAIASLQSKEHREIFGGLVLTPTPTTQGMCSNDNSYDAKFNPIGKCNRTATTSRKDGFGRSARVQPFCDQCARLIDESRAEMQAEARMS